ncbi:MAG: tRNA 2-thiouridine(34) synthase MnmA [Aquificae bacterium]|nr:tRNA 2-thiouridine(34) synthase MnmA [Aquificota bacterium]
MKTVAVGMSGGVDSSVSALLLKEQGYNVIGISLKFTTPTCDATDIQVCCSPQDIKDAKKVAEYLDIPHYVFDWEEVFYNKVIKQFVEEYKRGKTPNPCSLCNREVKTGLLAKFVKEGFGIDFFATGHYLGVVDFEGSKVIKRGIDRQKDQSYFMALLRKEVLPYLIFPLHNLTKEEVRKIAKEYKIPVAQKKESFEICFTEGKAPHQFLAERGFLKEEEGDIVLTTGEVVGKHKGLSRYTIGQRRGIGVRWKKPLYVIGKDIKNNRLIVGTREELLTDFVDVEWLNLFIPFKKLEKLNIQVQGRYKQKPVPVKGIQKLPEGGFRFHFQSPTERFASGQTLAVYHGDILLGGGVIS